LKSLGGLIKLETLKLRATRVTDAGLESLKRLKALKSLDLRFDKVSNAGVAQLKETQKKLDVVK